MGILDLDPWILVSAATGLALAGVGVYVARVGRGEHANRSFGLYAAGFGLAAAVDNVAVPAAQLPTAVDAGLEIAAGILASLGLVGLTIFALSFPRALVGRARRDLVWPVLAFGIGMVATIPLWLEDWAGWVKNPEPWGQDVAHLFSTVAFDALRVGLLCAALFFAFRFRAARDDPSDEAQRIAIVASAVMIYPLAFAGYSEADDVARGEFVDGTAFLVASVLLVVLTVFWLANTRSAHHRAAARNVALVGCGAMLLGMGMSAGGVENSPSWLMRILEILLLAYAVVRYQMLGIDVKLRWGISKGTLGAVFVGVFFVGSELAQSVFGRVANSQLVGILAAGGLVFALAPLQRAADRLAERAVPLAPPPAPAAPSVPATALYRQQVELAWTDGRISPNERVMLRGLRKNLGLDADAADAIEHEVETRRMRGD